jgi:hypothetical protein
MVSNHRLVLFTHALCRLSYPAVGGKTNGPDIGGLSKIAHFQKIDLAARWDAQAGRSHIESMRRASIACRGGTRFSARRATIGSEGDNHEEDVFVCGSGRGADDGAGIA